MKKFSRIQRALPLSNIGFAVSLVFSVFTILSCNKSNHGREHTALLVTVPDSVYVNEGNRIVAVTFDTLRNSLLEAIRSHGIEEAITFCNEKAYPITAVYADNVVIRRTSIHTRNPANNPDSLELLVLEEMNEQVKVTSNAGTKIARHESSGEIHYFKSILLQPMCLNCHGTPGKQIQNNTLARIQQLYPDDQAVNFKEGDLRGIWHIIFKPTLEQTRTTN